MNKSEIQEMLYEYVKSSDKTLSNFMSDVTKKLSEEPRYFTLHQEEDRENFRKLFEGIEGIKEHLKNQDERSTLWREQMQPMLDNYNKAVTVRDFFKGAAKFIIATGIFTGSVLALFSLFNHK